MSVGKLVLGALKEAFLLSPPEKQPQEPLTLDGPNRIPGFRPPIDWLNAELERRNPNVQARREELGLVRDEQTRQLLASPGPAGQATRGADFLTRREGRHHPYDRKGGTAGDGAAGATNNGGAPFRTPGPRVQIDFAGDDPLTTVVTRPPVGSHRPVLGRPGWQQQHQRQLQQHTRPHASSAAAAADASRWTGAAAVGSQHRYPGATRHGAGTYQTAADFAAFLAVRERANPPSPDANEGDDTFKRSAVKQAAAAMSSRGRRETEEDREERLAREAADASPIADALQTRMFTGHYAHGPRPITPFREKSIERGAAGVVDDDAVRNASIREAAERTFRAGAERIASATPDMAALHSRAGFRAGYHVAAAQAAAASGGRESSRRAPAAGSLFGGALAPAQLEFRRSSAWKTLGLDVRDVDAYKKLVEASSAGRNRRRRPTSAPPDSARKQKKRDDDDDTAVVDDDTAGGAPKPAAAKGRGKPKKPVTQYRMKAPPDAEVARTAVRRTSLDSFVDDSIENLRRSTAQAEGDVAPPPTAAPVRTALTPSQRREIALEVRAANASVHAPVDVAQEADLERQIAEMEIVAKDLESRRAELKSPVAPALSDLVEAGPSAAEIEAMEAELTRPISAAQADAIERAHAPGPPSEVIASGTFTGQGALEMTRKDVATMATGEWLNDEMVNFTIGTMADREMARCGGAQPRVHFFNTFFVGKLTDGGDGYNYGAVRRWTTKKKLGYDVLECDKVIIPVHQGIHWVLAVVDLRATCVRFYDSLLGDDKGLVEDLLRWVRDEWKNKKDADVDTDGWSVEIPKDIPRQMNGCDCGVFMLKYADYIATGCLLTFHQRDMEYFRRRIVADAMEKGN